jgi:hypothetical protein
MLQLRNEKRDVNAILGTMGDDDREKTEHILAKLKQSADETLIGRSNPTMKKIDVEIIDNAFAMSMNEAGFLARKYILQPEENFRGMSYGDLIARWNNWLLSSHPYYDGSDILFLRGNMGYYTDPKAFLDMSDLSANGQTIPYGTAIFVPIITCQWNIGDYYEGKRIEDEETMRAAVRNYIDRGGPMWATGLETDTNKLFYVDEKLKRFYVESPRFQLDVSPQSTLRTMIDDPPEPGQYDAVIGGYCVLLKDLPDGKYRLRFGGKGRRVYYTDSVWDITVMGDENSQERMSSVKDISKLRHPDQSILDKYFIDKPNSVV